MFIGSKVLFTKPTTIDCGFQFICILSLQEDELKKAILVVFANKQDIEGAMTVTEVANALGLSSLKNRKYQIFKTSAIKGEGLDEAMEWWVEIGGREILLLRSIVNMYTVVLKNFI